MRGLAAAAGARDLNGMRPGLLGVGQRYEARRDELTPLPPAGRRPRGGGGGGNPTRDRWEWRRQRRADQAGRERGRRGLGSALCALLCCAACAVIAGSFLFFFLLVVRPSRYSFGLSAIVSTTFLSK